MNRQLYIIGAGGLGQEIGAYIKHINSDYVLKGFYDDDLEKQSELAPIVGNLDDLNELPKGTNLIVGIGVPSMKASLVSRIKKPERFFFPSFIQPMVYLGDEHQISLEEGACICAGSSLTTSIHIGKYVLVNLNVTIGHDVTIGSFSSIMPGANISGGVTIGHGVLIGSGATILQGLEIGDQAIVGAGAVVTKDVVPGTTVMGVPARLG